MHTAVVSPPPPSRKAPDSVLTLGESVYITAAMPPEPADPSERSFCVKKNRGAVVFCVEPVDWPAKLARQLRVNSVMYQGAQAIVRYDDGLATRVHAIFPAEAFGVLLAHYTQRFGNPTATSERAIAPFGQPRQPNQVVSWQRMVPLTHERPRWKSAPRRHARRARPDSRSGGPSGSITAMPPIFPVLIDARPDDDIGQLAGSVAPRGRASIGGRPHGAEGEIMVDRIEIGPPQALQVNFCEPGREQWRAAPPADT